MQDITLTIADEATWDINTRNSNFVVENGAELTIAGGSIFANDQ